MADGKVKAPKKEVEKTRFDRVSPSSLPLIEQCPRWWAIGRDYDKARKAHPDLPEDGETYKMVFGSIFHKVMELKRFEPKEIHETAESMVGERKLKYDSNYTGVRDLARGVYQGVKALKSSPHFMPWKTKRDNVKLEQKCEGEFEGMKMAGIVDCIEGDLVVDLKTTTPSNKTWHGSQLTAYWMLAKKAGYKVCDKVNVIKVFRPFRPTDESGVLSQHISAKHNEKHVRRLIRLAKQIRADMPKWEGDYRAIAYNPSADRCRYCPARATSACPETAIW